MRPHILRMLLLALGVAAWPQALYASSSTAPAIPTELWVTGHDGLSQRFAASLRHEIEKSKSFTVATSKSEDALVLTIPSNVYPQPVEGRTNFQYVVIFTDRQSKYLGVSVGSCWEDSIQTCTLRVLRQAELAWNERSKS